MWARNLANLTEQKAASMPNLQAIPDSVRKTNALSALDNPGALADLPRREFIKVSSGDTDLPQMRFVAFPVNHLRSLRRFFNWVQLLLYFSTMTLFDELIGRDSANRRAKRLRRAFERAGGSFIKLGIHLSMRVDFIPWAYSNELSCLTDKMPAFPVNEAIAIIERSTKKPLAASFSSFDPQPINSNSVACVYQAILHNGEKVAVKVRRPGIGEQFMADIEAFDWLLIIAEVLTIFRPGFSQEMREEFRNLLLEELDFVQEARRQDAFRRAAAESRKDFFSAPHIFLELSGEEVVVSCFANGMWLWELLTAVEQGNETYLSRARELKIDPRKVAKHLLWVNYWAREENLFFHADPNSNNIIISQDGKLFFINFAVTGNLSRTLQQALRQNLYYAWQRDPQNMARASLILMEPLPPVDLIELTQELESYNWQLLYALEADPRSLPWQERTSSVQWRGLLRLARKYGITIDIEVLRLIRSTLLLESMAVRLDNEINFVHEYRKFDRYKAEQARRRVTNTVLNQLEGKSNEQLIIRMDRLFQTMEGLFFRTIHMFSLPTVNFNVLMSKWSFTVYILVRFFTQVLGITALAVGIGVVYFALAGRVPFIPSVIITWSISNPLYYSALILLIFINGRTALFRMDDKEI